MLAKSALVCLLFATVALAAKLTPLYDVDKALDYFLDFVQKYDKNYGHGEAASRFQIFTDNLARLNRFNEEYGQHVFRIHENLDITDEEFDMTHLGSIHLENITLQEPPPYIFGNFTAPDSLDWRDRNVVAPIQTQKRNDCYAFSAVATIESQNAIKTQNLIKLSEQQVDDCDRVGGDDPDTGGRPDNVFTYAAGFGGLLSEADYPYTGVAQQCSAQPDKIQVKVTGGKSFEQNEDQLLNTVATYGPVSIIFTATQSFKNAYGFTGVFTPTDCSEGGGSHAINIVGYGSDNGTPYWILRNSWGTTWGDQGYIKFSRGQALCDLSSYVATAEVA